MRNDLHEFDDIVHYSVRYVKGTYGDAEYKAAVTIWAVAGSSVTTLFAKKAEK